MMAAAELTSVSRMREYVGDRQGWTGVQQVRDAVALADDHSRSPQETGSGSSGSSTPAGRGRW